MTRQTNPHVRIDRRGFLSVGGISLLGLSLPGLLARESYAATSNTNQHPAKNVIMIWLSGGPSTIDMWDLKPAAKKAIRGEFSPISTSADGIEICEHLPQLAKQMHHCTIVRSLHHTIAEHTQGTEHVMTGNPISPAIQYPSLGSIVSKKLGASSGMPAYINASGLDIGQAGYLGSTHNPFVVDGFGPRRGQGRTNEQFNLANGFTISDLNRKSELLKKVERGFRRFDNTRFAAEMTQFQRQAVDILGSGKTRDALDINKEPKKVVERYGFGPLGRRALAARRLIQAGVRFVTIGFDGWDTHSNNFQQLRNQLLPQLDSAVAMLLHDLHERGLLESTVVYCAGEFNRTPIINPQGGRDHWARSMSVLLAGGGLQRGLAYGSTDKNGIEPNSHSCSPADINSTIMNQLGVSPGETLTTNSGRPMQLFKGGSVITQIIA